MVYDLKVEDVFKASWLWLRTGNRPNMIPDDIHKDRVIFTFPDNEIVRNEVKNFLADTDRIKTYVNFYKILRSEMYVFRGKKNNGNDF